MKQQQQAILARDMIQMIREYQDDAQVLEYLESFSSSIARLVENTDTVNWDDIASVCDQRYWSLKQENPIPLNDELLTACERSFSTFLPS